VGRSSHRITISPLVYVWVWNVLGLVIVPATGMWPFIVSYLCTVVSEGPLSSIFRLVEARPIVVSYSSPYIAYWSLHAWFIFIPSRWRQQIPTESWHISTIKTAGRHQMPVLVLVFSPVIPVYTSPSYFFMINFNIIPSTDRFSK
jgi:hypothetical protein